jgi:hypothetical protein
VLVSTLGRLQSFGAPQLNPAANSAQPGPVLVDPAGNLFGLTAFGGAVHGGYALPARSRQLGALRCCTISAARPLAPTAAKATGGCSLQSGGNLFGTASLGGAGAECKDDNGCGVAFG